MTMRRLDDNELKVSHMMVSRLTQRNDYLDYIKSHAQLMIDKGLQVNFEEQMSQYKEKLSNAENETTLNKDKIRILTDQIRNGVEIKENKEEIEEKVE